jgi:glycosyltransferase involved in cell wall biosynthesis
MQRSHGVLSVSEDLKTKICQLGVEHDKIHVVYNGVDRECFFYRDMKDTRAILDIELNAKIILFVGNLLESKGVLDLLQAFEKVCQILSDVFLYYIGGGGDAIRITAFSQDKGLKERVTLLGEKDHKDIALWYAAADLVALPSHREGVPNVLLEAMACGTPVLATRIGGIPEVISEDVGVLVEAHDIESITSGLLQALSKPWEISKILRQSEAFSWERNVAAVRALIEQTLKSVTA